MHIFQHIFILANGFLNGPYGDVKDYAEGDIGYHAAILKALKFFRRFDILEKYSDFIELRVAADYDIVDIISIEDAKTAIELADEICNALQ